MTFLAAVTVAIGWPLVFAKIVELGSAPPTQQPTAELRSFLLGWREFKSREEIAEYIVHSLNFDSRREVPSAAKTLLLFQTSRQRTWLVATSERLYCILDDVRKPEPHINWSLPRPAVASNGEIVLEIRPHDRTAKTGLVDFGDEHRRWLYTRDLFEHGDITSAIRDFLIQAMGSEPRAPAAR